MSASPRYTSLPAQFNAENKFCVRYLDDNGLLDALYFRGHVATAANVIKNQITSINTKPSR
jgi:hypothetical protein